MIIALIDNGSLQPAAHRNLRNVAAALSAHAGVKVRAVSWRHSDRIDDHDIDGVPAWTLDAFMRSFVALGQREFVLVPFFVCPAGAIGSVLQREIETLQRELGAFDVRFTAGLAEQGVIPSIVADRVRTCIAAHGLSRPAVVVVDHGGPSAAAAGLREELATEVRVALEAEVRSIATASMEGAHPPLLHDLLRQESLSRENVVVAPLFLSPGRHAGPDGDLARICRQSHSRCHLADLVGTHPLAVEALADALRAALSNIPEYNFA
jgi:sirohydrochlorin ferrochelatase